MDVDEDSSRDGTSMTWGNFAGRSTRLGSAASFEAVTADSVGTAYAGVPDYAGAFWWNRDSVDTRQVTDVEDADGDIINSQGSHPTINSVFLEVNFDTDGDGMSDIWENANGTNPDTADNSGDIDGEVWRNLEEHINSLAQ